MLLVRAGTPDLVAGPDGRHPGLALDRDQEAEVLQRPPDGLVVGQLAGLVELAEAERCHACLDLVRVADAALAPGRPDHALTSFGSWLAGSVVLDCSVSRVPFSSAERKARASLRPAISSTVLPRSSAISWAVRSDCSASIAARTVLIGLLVPSDLVRMSLMPDASITARIAPPEITPVPGAAGFMRILAAPHLKRPSRGIVVPTIGA